MSSSGLSVSIVESKSHPGRKGRGRDRLVAAARTLFGERGFEAVATKELALSAGLTIGALYHHFPSKEVIYRAALENAIEGLPEAPIADAERLDPRAALDLLVAWFSDTLVREPLLRHELLDPHLDCSLTDLPFFKVALTVFDRLMPVGAPSVDPALAISAIVSLTFGLTSLKGLSGGFTPPSDPLALAPLITRLVLGES